MSQVFIPIWVTRSLLKMRKQETVENDFYLIKKFSMRLGIKGLKYFLARVPYFGIIFITSKLLCCNIIAIELYKLFLRKIAFQRLIMFCKTFCRFVTKFGFGYSGIYIKPSLFMSPSLALSPCISLNNLISFCNQD